MRRQVHVFAFLLLTLAGGLAAGGTIERLSPTGQQPTVLTPQGKAKELYKASHALLISESAYLGPANNGWRPLPNTAAEMDQLAATLRKQGFNVWRVRDAGGDELRGYLRDFLVEAGRDRDHRLLVFFSGHGFAEEQPPGTFNEFGYVVPVDAVSPSYSFAQFQRKALPIADFVQMANEILARHALFIFDSCFSGTVFTTRGDTLKPIDYGLSSSARWSYLTGSAAQPVRQFISAGGAGQTLPAQSIFLPMLIQAIDGSASIGSDGYVTGRDVGNWLMQNVPKYAPRQTPQSGVINSPVLSMGDIVFQYRKPEATKTPVIGSGQPASATYTVELPFDFDKAYLRPEGLQKIDELLTNLNLLGVTITKVDLSGRAETNVGQSQAYALKLAQRRAEAAKSYLIQKGIDASIVTTFSRLAETDGSSAAEREQNRRVKLEITFAPKS
jgi:outer membrane protein OmpA-like peptidoglycan-associated protein